ncbi:MAG: hypothetical protein ACKVUS_05520, partial [Saprospiraceae bacterium]
LHWNGLAAIDLSKAAEQGFLGKTPPMAGRTGTTITLRQGKYSQGFLAAKPSVEKLCVKWGATAQAETQCFGQSAKPVCFYQQRRIS